MPAKSKTYKKKPKAKPSQRRQRGAAEQARAMTAYIPFFRRINAPRQFTRLLAGFQGVIAPQNISGGYFSILPGQFEIPLDGTVPFNSAFNGNGTATGGTSLTSNYAGYTMLISQYAAYRVHTRRLTVTVMPSLAGDQIQFAMMPSNQINPPAVNNFATYAGNSRGKTRMVAFGGEPGKLSYKQHLSELVGLTRAQWEAQPPTRVATAPANVLFIQDFVLWTTVDGGTLTGNLVFSVTLEIEIELSEAISLQN